MKKIVFSAAVVLGTLSICAANFGNTTTKLPVRNNYISRDTVPSDTTQPADSSRLLIK